MTKSAMENSRNSTGGNTLLPQAGHSAGMETPVLRATFSYECYGRNSYARPSATVGTLGAIANCLIFLILFTLSQRKKSAGFFVPGMLRLD